MIVDITDPSIGAVPDGTVSGGVLSGTDNRAAIQSALDTGYDVLIPRGGIFAKRGTLLMRTASQRLFGEGENSVVGDMNINWTPSGLGTTITSNGIAIVSGFKNVRVQDFKLIGCATNENATYVPSGVLVNSDAYGYQGQSAQDGRASIRQLTISGIDASHGYNNGIINALSDNLRADDTVIDSLVGVNSGYGYGILVSGKSPVITNNRITSTISGQGRHGIYVNYCSGALIDGNTVSTFARAGIPFNTGTTNDTNLNIITRNKVLDCCKNSSSSGDAAISVSYQNPATAAGADTIVTANIILNSGRSAFIASGYQRLKFSENVITNFSKDAASCHGVIFDHCDDVDCNNNSILSAYADANLVFVEIICSNRTKVNANSLRNTSATTARASIRNNASTPLTSNSRVFNNPNFGSFSFNVENPTQSGSTAATM